MPHLTARPASGTPIPTGHFQPVSHRLAELLEALAGSGVGLRALAACIHAETAVITGGSS